jgi:hypothetical protein
VPPHEALLSKPIIEAHCHQGVEAQYAVTYLLNQRHNDFLSDKFVVALPVELPE